MKKLLSITSYIYLFLILISIEIGFYLFYVLPKQNKTFTTLFSKNQNETDFKENPKNFLIRNEAIPLQNIQYLQNSSNTFLLSSQVTNTYKGSVISIKNNTKDNKIYKIILTLKDSSGGVFAFAYSENDLKNIRITDTKTNEILHTLNDLHQNDNLTITERLDLKKFFGNNRILVAIQKL